jgi:hypothetical protein
MPYERKTFDIEISDKLREVLQAIEQYSVVAKLLLKRRHSKEILVDDPVNFVSISSQDSSRISYLTTERIGQIDSNDFWTSSRRFHAKPGAFISKIFKGISNQDVETFSNLYRAESNKPKFTLKVVSGNDIQYYYHGSKHASDNGSLGVSCMRYDRCQKYFGLYTKNSDKISMLVMLDSDDMVMARALLWDFDGHKIMDRIYSINDEQLPFYLKKWAEDNGYYYRTQQNWFNSLFFNGNGEKKKRLELKVKLNRCDFEYYPYLDTFRFINFETGELTNYLPSGRNFSTLCSSDGDTFRHNYLGFDDIDNIFRHLGDLVRVKYLDIYTHHNNCYYSDINDDYILCKDATYSETVNDYIFNSEYDSFNNHKKIEDMATQKPTRDKLFEDIYRMLSNA